MIKKIPSFTVGIPTYYGGPSLIQAIKSVLASKGVAKNFRFIVTVDGNPLKKNIRQQLEKLKIEVIENKQRGGQVARVKQIMKLCKTSVVVITQDDIIFEKNTLKELLLAFNKHPDATMIGANVKGTTPHTFLEKVVNVGVAGTYQIGKQWHGGDNYLLASGRCLAFKTKYCQKFTIPEEVINSDAYFYFENKELGGQFYACDKAIVYNQLPQRFAEHLNQTRKFAVSQKEIEKYIKKAMAKEYQIPLFLSIKVLVGQFIKQPFLTISYLIMQLYAQFIGRQMFKEAKRFWSTDLSTKRVTKSKKN
jgi:cellulose synthase/poly-beta-1,6-N-acetylglucosamine synthase-like glycosyltransferase